MPFDICLRLEDQELAREMALHEYPVLITGPAGTGKSTLARWIHKSSSRSGRPLVELNCGAIPASLCESELFGHLKGAFTGATEFRLGSVACASDGTLFLDEIGDLPLDLQVKLLRLLEERRYKRVGADKDEEAKCRFLMATNRDLQRLCAAGQFREDLYYRIRTLPLSMPPLRDLDGAAVEIAQAMVREHVQDSTKHSEIVRAVEVLSRQPDAWRGNVRELKTFIVRCSVLGLEQAERLQYKDWAGSPAGAPAKRPSVESLARVSPNDCEQLAYLIRHVLEKRPASSGTARRGRPKKAAAGNMPHRLAARLLGGPLSENELSDILSACDETLQSTLKNLKNAGLVEHTIQGIEAIWPPAETWLFEQLGGSWRPVGAGEIPVAYTGDRLRLEVHARCRALLSIWVVTHVRGYEPSPSEPPIREAAEVTDDAPAVVEMELRGNGGLEQILVHLQPATLRSAVSVEPTRPEPLMPDRRELLAGRNMVFERWGAGWVGEHRVFHADMRRMAVGAR